MKRFSLCAAILAISTLFTLCYTGCGKSGGDNTADVGFSSSVAMQSSTAAEAGGYDEMTATETATQENDILKEAETAIPGLVTEQMPYSLLAGEDFAYYAEKVPGVYFMLGALSADREPYPWHHPRFDIDEAALPIGSCLLAECVYILANQDRK